MKPSIICVRCHRKSYSDYDSEFEWKERSRCGDYLQGELCEKCSHELRNFLIEFIGIKEDEDEEDEATGS